MATPGTMVPMVGDDGKVYNIPAANVAKAEASGKLRRQTEAEIAKVGRVEKAKGIAGAVATAGLEGIGELTLGLTNSLLRQSVKYGSRPDFDPETGKLRKFDKIRNVAALQALADQREALREAHPVITQVSRLGGILGPALVSGGTSLAAKGGIAGARALPTAFVSDLGRLAEGFIAKKVTREGAKGLGAKLVENLVPKAAGGFVEGLPYGVSAAISGAAADNADLTAERLIAGAGLGGIIGGAAGGAFGLGGLISREAAKQARAVAAKVGNKNVGKIISKQLTHYKARAMGLSKANRASMFRAAKESGLEDFADDVVRKADDVEGIALKLDEAHKAAGARVGQAIDDLDAVADAVGTRFNMSPVVKKMDDVVAALEASPVNAQFATRLQKLRDNFADIATRRDPATGKFMQARNFREVDQFRRELDRIIPQQQWKVPVGEKPMWDAHKDFRRILAGEVEDQLNSLEAIAPDGLMWQWRTAKKAYAKYSDLKGSVKWDKAIEKASEPNPLFSFTDKVAAGPILAAGIVGSAVTANPLPLIGAVGTLAMKVGAEHASATLGPKLAAAGIDYIAKKEAARAISGQVRNRMAGHIARALTGKAKYVAIPTTVQVLTRSSWGEETTRKGASKLEAFHARRDEIDEAMGNPDTFAERLGKRTAELHDIDPELAQSVMTTAQKGISFLHDKAPRNAAAHRTLNPLIRKWEPSDEQLAKFARYAAAVDNPMTVFEDLENGRVSREGVEVLREVYPEMYAEAQVLVMELAADHTEDIGYDQKVQLSILFQVALDTSMEPEAILAFQATFMSTGPQAGPKQGPPKPQKLSVKAQERRVESGKTTSQRLET